MYRFIFIQAFFFLSLTADSQPKTDTLLAGILSRSGNELLHKIANDPGTYRLQVVYTQIERDKNNKPSFKNYYYNYDPHLYFNPASMVKMPLAFLSLEKLSRMNKPGVDKYTRMRFDSGYTGQRALGSDTTSESGYPSIAHFIKRAFLISENDPYNRMYQFVGQQDINRKLHEKGYPDTRITRQFMGFSEEQNRYTNPIVFIDRNGKEIYRQPLAYNKNSFDFSREIKLGKAHWNRYDSLIQAPFDFTKHNNLALEDMQQMLQSVLFPGSVSKEQRFELTADDLAFLYRYLSQFPSETSWPKYDTSEFYDSYVKFFFRDSTKKMPPHVRVFNKVGWSYGFLTDVSYVIDFEHKVEYMLAATVYVNSDGVLNDNRYEYNSVGHPFLYQLGQAIYQYELGRKRKYHPDLSRFRINYDRRDPADTRPSLREVDN
jgi:hypothetical protein